MLNRCGIEGGFVDVVRERWFGVSTSCRETKVCGFCNSISVRAVGHGVYFENES